MTWRHRGRLCPKRKQRSEGGHTRARSMTSDQLFVPALQPFLTQSSIADKTVSFRVSACAAIDVDERAGMSSDPGVRPEWWGRLFVDLIHGTLNADVVEYLRKNESPVGIPFQRLIAENTGARMLISRCYEIIGNLLELA